MKISNILNSRTKHKMTWIYLNLNSVSILFPFRLFVTIFPNETQISHFFLVCFHFKVQSFFSQWLGEYVVTGSERGFTQFTNCISSSRWVRVWWLLLTSCSPHSVNLPWTFKQGLGLLQKPLKSLVIPIVCPFFRPLNFQIIFLDIL